MCGCVRGTTITATARGRDGEGGGGVRKRCRRLDIFRCEATPAPVMDSQQPGRLSASISSGTRRRGTRPMALCIASCHPISEPPVFWGGGDIWGKGNGNRHLAVVPTPQGAARPSDIRQTGASVSVGMKHGERGEKKKTHLRWDEWCRRRRRLDGRRHAGQPSRRTCLSRRRIVCVCVGGGRWAVDGDTTWPDTRRAQPAMREEEVSVWTAYGGGWRREDRGGRRWTGTGMDDCSSTRGTKDPGQVRSPKVQGGGIGGFFSFSPASRSHEDGEKSFDSDPESDRE